jgi:hypothetical protein
MPCATVTAFDGDPCSMVPLHASCLAMAHLGFLGTYSAWPPPIPGQPAAP